MGLNLTAHDVRNGQLLPAIRAVGTDENVQQQCQWLADEFENLGGAEKAAQLLNDLLPT